MKKILVAAISVISMNAMAQDISNVQKQLICEKASVETKQYISTDDCLKSAVFDIGFYSDWSIHGMSSGDVDFSIYDVDGSPLMRGYVELKDNDTVREEVFAFSPLQNKDFRFVGGSDLYKSSNVSAFATGTGKGSERITAISSAVATDVVKAAVQEFDKNVRGSLVVQTNRVKLLSDVVSLDVLVLLQGEVERSECKINTQDSEAAIAQEIASCISDAQKMI